MVELFQKCYFDVWHPSTNSNQNTVSALRYCYEQCKAAMWKQNINLFSLISFLSTQLSHELEGGKATIITLTYMRPFRGPKDTLKTPGISVQMCFRYSLHISKEWSMVDIWGEFHQTVSTALEDLSAEVCSLFWEMESRSPSRHKLQG